MNDLQRKITENIRNSVSDSAQILSPRQLADAIVMGLYTLGDTEQMCITLAREIAESSGRPVRVDDLTEHD